MAARKWLFDDGGEALLFMCEFKGAMAENFVLQQLLFMGVDLPYYWISGNLAEVDFVVQLLGLPIPIEVKAGKTIRSKT